MKKLFFLFVVSMMTTAVMAQDNLFTIDAQVRARGEYNNGAIKPREVGEKSALFINERARVALGFERKNLEMRLSAQHTGVWGQDDIKDRKGRVAMNEAWAKVKFCDGWFVQLGRQVLAYDDERILGGLDWNVAGNSHDALRMGYENGGHRFHTIFSINQTAENVRGNYYTGPMPYKNMQAAWYHLQGSSAPVGVSLLAMNLGRQTTYGDKTVNRYMQTFGTDITYRPKQWDLHFAGYLQTGKNLASQTVQAWMLSGKVGYRIGKTWKLHVGYDHLSGNDGADDKDHAFDPLYGTHHKFYGSMDYFTGKVNCGLQDVQAGVSAQACKAVNLQVNYHYLLTSEKLGELNRGLGHEVDLQLTAKVMKDVTLMAGYSFMCGSETMDALKGGDHRAWQDWAWVTVNINPRLLAKKW